MVKVSQALRRLVDFLELLREPLRLLDDRLFEALRFDFLDAPPNDICLLLWATLGPLGTSGP